MALKGTISDFGLADICQLIGIQRKTGVLTLDSGEEVVSVKFVEGEVVGADTRSQSVEDLLGAVLVRTGRITEAQLAHALKLQKRTLQRLGYVLVDAKLISEPDLVEALRVQSLQIIYRLFRWRSGSYDFTATDNLDYDEKHFAPIRAETILMEGARMIDEWPIIERKVTSDDQVFRLTPAGRSLQCDVDSIGVTDLDIQFRFDDEGHVVPGQKERASDATLSSEEREILSLIDGKRTAAEINDCSTLGEFDTYRILADMLTRSFIEKVKRATAHDAATRPKGLSGRLFQALLGGGLGLVALATLATLHDNTMSPWRLIERETATAQLHLYASRARLERIEQAIAVYYLDTASFPPALEALAQHGHVRIEDLVDPWGRSYAYVLDPGGYQLFGLDEARQPVEALRLSRQFSAAERMMTGAAGSASDVSER